MIEFDPASLIQAVQETASQVTGLVDEPVLRAVAYSGADLFRDQAKQNALKNKKTGVLFNNIIVKRLEEESDGGKKQAYLVTVRKGPRGGDDAYYWRWVEFGHKVVGENRNIDPRTGRKTNWEEHRAAEDKKRREAINAEFGSATVEEQPFMRPAFDNRKADAMDLMTRTLAEQIARNSR